VRLAENLWTEIARGANGDASALLEPDSPADVLYRVLGESGLTQAIGMAPGVPPYSYTAGVFQLGASAELISGRLIGMDETEHTYFLSCRDGLITEVLPCPVLASGEFWHLFWRWNAAEESWNPRSVPRTAGLDVVGRTLLRVGPAWHGLAVTARSVTAWERIAESSSAALTGNSPLAVAAAVDRLVDYRAGGRATFAQAATAYAIGEQEIRRADRAVRPALALGPDRPGDTWVRFRPRLLTV
jgi:hypothetical protein